ncbi:MAG: HAD family hydrolase [Candidatus Verstraetearchaeota archaeon]|nr:HAD family hydrolase [Candidatus Verstraetearchaeota archaeon]
MPLIRHGVILEMRAVIFDLDGVLVKFNIDSLRIKEDVIAYFESQGFPSGVLKPSQSFSTIKATVETHFLGKGMSRPEVTGILRRGEAMAVDHEIRAARSASLLPGVKETIKALKEGGIKCAIFTYNNSKAVKTVLERHCLEGCFDAVVSRDQTENPKPSPLHLKKVLDLLNIGTGEALVVGDSEMDIKPSKELGVKVAGITTGIRSEEELRAFEPDYLINSLPEILEILATLPQEPDHESKPEDT